MTLLIPISLPPLILRNNSSNGRSWMKRKARQEQRAEAADAARCVMSLAGITTPPKWKAARYHLTAYTFRQWDEDNLIASLKGAFDGLVDAGLLSDDRHLKISGSSWVKTKTTIECKIILEVTLS